MIGYSRQCYSLGPTEVRTYAIDKDNTMSPYNHATVAEWPRPRRPLDPFVRDMSAAQAIKSALELSHSVGTNASNLARWPVVWTEDKAFVFTPTDNISKAVADNPPAFTRKWLLYCLSQSWPSYMHYGDVPQGLEILRLPQPNKTTILHSPYAGKDLPGDIRPGILSPALPAQANHGITVGSWTPVAAST